MLLFVVFSILFQCIFCEEEIICESQLKRISCPSDQVIRIRSAQWGRTSTSICRNGPYSNNPFCYTFIATDYIKNWCEGRQTCTIEASNNIAGGNDPCFGTYKYLDIDYKCERNVQNLKVCDYDQVLSIDCPAKTLIRVLSAIYGRHSKTVCPLAGHDQFVDCGLDETNMIKLVCDGLQACRMKVGISEFKYDPCVGTFKYTDVDYVCEPEIPGEQRAHACDGGTISMTCSTGTIQILQATYGRTGTSLCPGPGQFDNTQCATNQTPVVSQRCNGSKSCTFPIGFPADPCVGIYKYLEVRYLCR